MSYLPINSLVAERIMGSRGTYMLVLEAKLGSGLHMGPKNGSETGSH
jgi:hypothetical protein